jgi:3-oxoadipate enol-lactonase
MIEFSYLGSDGCPLYATTLGPAGDGRGLVLLHGGGPDHHSLVPLARQLADLHTVVLPDIRGYGRSVCTDPTRHTWAQYSADVIALLDHLGMRRAVVGGAGIGTTITLRTALAYPERVRASVLISVEDIEDDQRKEAEIEFLDAFAVRVRTEGIEAAWKPILENFPPIIGAMVRDAIPRSDPSSIAAAAAIGHDRAFRSVNDLALVPHSPAGRRRAGGPPAATTLSHAGARPAAGVDLHAPAEAGAADPVAATVAEALVLAAARGGRGDRGGEAEEQQREAEQESLFHFHQVILLVEVVD